MHGKNFVICDSQEQYSRNLLLLFRQKKSNEYQYYLFHTWDELEKFAQKKRIYILLMDESYPEEQIEKIAAEKKMILTAQEGKNTKGLPRIYRYQNAEEIWKQVQKEAMKKRMIRKKVRKKKEGELIAVYSPVHRIGKTRFAIESGRQWAEKEPVLYLNLEEYSGGGHYFQEQQEKNLGDLLYYLRQEKGNLGMRISMIAGQYENLDYIMPIPCVQDLRAVKGEEWINLCERILKECIYEKVILDLGDSVEGLYSILKKCTKIYTPYIDDPTAAAKMKQYVDNVRKMGMEDILEKTIQMNMGDEEAVQS